MSAAEAFLDTNILVYHLEGAASRKGQIAESIVRPSLEHGSACVSFQVMQECLNTITRKGAINLDAHDARLYLRTVLAPLLKIMPSVELYERALETHSRYRYSFYDSLIIAAALEAGCQRLLSEDMQHGQQIEQLRIVNPFLER